MKNIICLLLFFLFTSGCYQNTAFLRRSLETDRETGEIFLYSRPFTQDSDRLTFNITEIAAISDSDIPIPLSLTVRVVKGPEMKRQMLVASGRLPSGYYKGFYVRAGYASLKTEEGEAALIVPEEPEKIVYPFHVSSRKSYVMSLTFDYSRSLRSGYSFSPVFSLSIPEKPPYGLLGFVVNHDSNNIMVFDKKTLQIVDAVSTGIRPRGIALDQNVKRAYVALSGEDSIEVIDIVSNTIINRIRLNTGDSPQEPVLTPDSRLLITANRDSDTISMIDPAAFIELKRINVGDGPNSVILDASGRRAYVFNAFSNDVSIVDIANMSVITTISAEAGPLSGQFNRAGDRLYIIHERSSYMTVLDPVSLIVLDRIFTGRGMRSLKIDTNTDFVYVGKENDNVVDMYDPFSMIPVDFINTGGSVAYMTIDGEENNLYLVVPEIKKLIVINLVSKKVLSKMDVADGAYQAVVMGER